MAKECEVTGKSSQIGGRLTNRSRATVFTPSPTVRRKANLKKKRVFVPELNKTFSLTLSTKAIKEINKNGAFKTLKKAGLI